jgi:arsenate reductase (thioredoxin)
MTAVTLVKRNVLFLCTGDSACSQMAEGLVNHRRGDEWHAVSAGTHPTGYVHPVAIAALKEIGVDISAARLKSTDEFRDAPFDLVVTVCDDAAENCPLFWLGQGKRTHIGFPDPAKASGNADQVLAAFRAVRDAIQQQVIPFLDFFGKETR